MNSKIALLLCTYQGERYLAKQLDSFAAQTCRHWDLYVSDDGSRDGTRELIEQRRKDWPTNRIAIFDGPRKGFSANFLSLICRPELSAEYYSISDQDDIWNPQKLERALQWLSTVPADIPALYCARTTLVDENEKLLGLSPLFTRPPSFANALVQNIAGGNTMVLNDAARRLVQTVGPEISVVAHDWWVYIVVTACGGRVQYDQRPSLLYRQHDGNLIGSNMGLRARLKRISMLFQGNLQQWSDQHVAALEKLTPHMTLETRRVFNIFAKARQQSLLHRIVGVKRSGIYRQTRMGTLGLYVAAFSNKI